MIISTFIAN